MATRPIQQNVVLALDRIGKTNGTAAPEITAPRGMTNKDAADLITERDCIFEYMIADQIASYAEKRKKKAKDAIELIFSDPISNTVPSTSSAVNRGDMSLNIERRKGRDMLDGALLMSALAKRGFDLYTCEAIIRDATKTSKPALYLRSSIIAKE